MASTAHSTRRKANLFGFGGKSTTFSSKALKDAYEAGYKGQSGHRDFQGWLGKQKGSGEFHSKFVGQLRGEYARGEKDYFNRVVTSPADAAPTVKAPHKWKYKGYTIEQAGEDFIVPKLDRESQFESLAEAKRFIMSNPKPKRNVRRGPIESTVTGATRTGMSVGRYLDSQLGKALGSNPKTKLDLMLDKIQSTGGEITFDVRDYTQKQKQRVEDTARGRGFHVSGDGKYILVRPAIKSNPGTRLTQGGAVAYITELDSGVYAAEVMAPGGAREEKEFKGRGGEEAAKGWARLRLWEVAGTARSNPAASAQQYRLAQAVLSGTARKGSTRMSRAAAQEIVSKTPAKLRSEFMRGNSRRPQIGSTPIGRQRPDYDTKIDRITQQIGRTKSPTALMKLFHKRDELTKKAAQEFRSNPESAAASMYSSFHGRDSQELIVIERDEHYHENVAGLGVCCGIIVDCLSAGTVTIGMSGYEWKGKLPKGKWHKSDGGFVKADTAAESVLLSSNEDGTQLFFDGGDQTLDVSVLGIEGPAAQKESIVIGEVSFIAYETEKEFDNFELVQYVHQFSEDSKGPLPQLRYDRLNQQMYLDGGVYFIEQPVMGVSPGIED